MKNEVAPGSVDHDDENARSGDASPPVVHTHPERFVREFRARLDRLETEFEALRRQLGELARGAA